MCRPCRDASYVDQEGIEISCLKQLAITEHHVMSAKCCSFWLQKVPTSVTMPVFRLLQQSLTNMHDSLASTCDANLYTLRYLSMVGKSQQPLKQLPSGQEDGGAEE